MDTNTTTKKQVAIVTGASSGMGLGITQALLQHGYRVVANSRNISKSKDLKPSSDLILVDGDISKMDSAIKVADAAINCYRALNCEEGSDKCSTKTDYILNAYFCFENLNILVSYLIEY
jgi:NAD(P)-dependent dehydrogenase (short-subunit alcohol dehydrogenase family)